MLIRFNVGNFLSFHDIQEFSMISGTERSGSGRIYQDTYLGLLKFAAIYGANASGKSNLVSALDFTRDTVLQGAPEGHPFKYCKVASENKAKPSYFELEIKIGSRYYSYGFEMILNQSSIVSEWLMEIYPDNSEKEIFTRDVKKGTFSVCECFLDLKTRQRLEIYADDIRNDHSILFLRLMNQNKDGFYKEHSGAEILREVYLWLQENLDINYPDKPLLEYTYYITEDNIAEITRILSAFGTGIDGMHMVDVSVDRVMASLPKGFYDRISSQVESRLHQSGNAQERILIRSNKKDFFLLKMDSDGIVSCKTLEFSHAQMDTPFQLAEESDGTLRIFDFIEVLLNETQGKVFVIDEIDRCLHPRLTYKFIETFLQLALQQQVQLIVTTHESRLLDFDLLRRDEIWFVNKNPNGASSIYSLEEYNTRFDQKIDRAYLEGRYGGTPIFSTVFPLKEETNADT